MLPISPLILLISPNHSSNQFERQMDCGEVWGTSFGCLLTIKYQSTCSDVQNGSFGLGHQSGRISFIHFDLTFFFVFFCFFLFFFFIFNVYVQPYGYDRPLSPFPSYYSMPKSKWPLSFSPFLRCLAAFLLHCYRSAFGATCPS